MGIHDQGQEEGVERMGRQLQSPVSAEDWQEIYAVMNSGMKGRVFKIIDRHERHWGAFAVEEETTFLNNHNIHGRLIPSADFEAVGHLFAQHEIAMEEHGDVVDVDVSEILDLNPYLLDEKTDERVNVRGLFINDKLLVTCGIE